MRGNGLSVGSYHRPLFLTIATTLWSVRLAGFLFYRVLQTGTDTCALLATDGCADCFLRARVSARLSCLTRIVSSLLLCTGRRLSKQGAAQVGRSSARAVCIATVLAFLHSTDMRVARTDARSHAIATHTSAF